MTGVAGLIGGGLTNSGSMPISAGGGAAGPSTAKSSTNTGFTVGAFNMGGGSSSHKTLLIVGAVVAIALFIVMKK